MTKPMIKMHNVETGEVIEREMNAKEFGQFEAEQAENQTRKELEAVKVAEKAALLSKLGITDDEAKLLLS